MLPNDRDHQAEDATLEPTDEHPSSVGITGRESSQERRIRRVPHALLYYSTSRGVGDTTDERRDAPVAA